MDESKLMRDMKQIEDDALEIWQTVERGHLGQYERSELIRLARAIMERAEKVDDAAYAEKWHKEFDNKNRPAAPDAQQETRR